MGTGFEQMLGTLEALWAAKRYAKPAESAIVARRWREEIGIAQVRCLHRTVDAAQYAAAAAKDDTDDE